MLRLLPRYCVFIVMGYVNQISLVYIRANPSVSSSAIRSPPWQVAAFTAVLSFLCSS